MFELLSSGREEGLAEVRAAGLRLRRREEAWWRQWRGVPRFCDREPRWMKGDGVADDERGSTGQRLTQLIGVVVGLPAEPW